MKLTLGFSPCPNDTYIFDALVHQKIDTGGLEFEAILEDVETLNEWALEGKLDVTKLSFPAFFNSLDKYFLLNSGSALGRGVGPLLIRNKKLGMRNEEIFKYPVALPGQNTTANFLFSFAFPNTRNKVFMRFDKIGDWVLEGNGLGVIIHEDRFTYPERGLQKILDLGEYWEEQTDLPVPLGGIAVKRDILQPVANKIDSLIRKSVEYARSCEPELPDYVRLYAQTMDENVMRQHIELYVNDYSLDLGTGGKKAIIKFHEVFLAQNPGASPVSSKEFFIS